MKYEDDFSEQVKRRLDYEIGPPWYKRKEHPKVDVILNMRSRGYSVSQIAKAHAISRTTIHRRLKAYMLHQEELERQEEERKQQIEDENRRRQEQRLAEEREKQKRIQAYRERKEKERQAQLRKEAEIAAAKLKKRQESRWRNLLSVPQEHQKNLR